MFDKFPRLTASLVAGVVGLPLAIQLKQALYPPYELGKKDGFTEGHQRGLTSSFD